MRLVVPQIPGLGVVQIDTGGVASSIQTLVWQLRMIERQTQGHMAGIAVRMSIRAFPDKFGNAAYSWQITPVRSDEAEELRGNVEVLTRIDGQIPKELPQIAEQVDPDVYGLPAPEEAEAGQPAKEADVREAVAAPTIPEAWASQILGYEALFKNTLRSAGLPPAKQEAIEEQRESCRALAAAEGDWEKYAQWLTRQIERLGEKAGEQQEALL
jgi:hypothetical protein